MDLRTLETELNEIARQANQARQVGEEWSNREWTQQVKDLLIRVGVEKGCIPYPHCGRGEFLYDVIWLQTTDGTVEGLLDHVPLVAEIEWGSKGDVRYDFQKLLVARADVRMMIFEDQGRLLEELRAHVVRVAQNGDNYLLARYLAVERRFAVEAWCLKVPD